MNSHIKDMFLGMHQYHITGTKLTVLQSIVSGKLKLSKDEIILFLGTIVHDADDGGYCLG